MDLFNVGSGEFLVLALLALLLFGPEELIKLLRTLREYSYKARRAWLHFSAELEQDVLTDEVKAVLQETRVSVDELQQGWRDIQQDLEDSLAPEFETAEPPTGVGP